MGSSGLDAARVLLNIDDSETLNHDRHVLDVEEHPYTGMDDDGTIVQQQYEFS